MVIWDYFFCLVDIGAYRGNNDGDIFLFPNIEKDLNKNRFAYVNSFFLGVISLYLDFSLQVLHIHYAFE